jgi:hypothetical protein
MDASWEQRLGRTGAIGGNRLGIVGVHGGLGIVGCARGNVMISFFVL